MHMPAMVMTLTLITSTTAHAALPKLAILPFTAKRIGPDTVAVLDDLLVGSVDRLHRYDIITASDINAMLGMEKMRDMLNCDSTSCIAEIGGALGVETLLAGSVSILGDEVIVSLSLIDAKNQHVQGREQVRVPNRESLYAGAIDQVVQTLFSPGAPAPNAVPTIPMAEVHFTHESDEPLGVFIRLADGDERHCPSGVTRNNPCTLQVPAGRVVVVTRGGAGRQALRLPADRVEYNLHVGPSRTGLITGGAIAAAGVVAIILGGVFWHHCTPDIPGDSCVAGGAIASLATGAAAVYGGGMTMFFAGVLTYDNSDVSTGDHQPVESGGWPMLVPSISPSGISGALRWDL